MEIRRIDRLGLGRSSLPSLVTRKRRVLDEACFRALTRQLPHRVVIKDTNSAFLSCNEAAARDLGLLPRDLIGKSDCDVFPAEIAERHRAEDLWVMQEGQISSFEALGVRNGESVWLHTTKTPIYDDAGALTGLMVVSEDITEKKREADELKRRGRALQALHGAHQALVHAESEMALLQGGCEAIALEAMYSLVWIGWASDDPERSVRLVAAAGKAVAFTDGLEVSWGDGPFGGGPTGKAIREGTTILVDQAATAESCVPWRERAERFGIRSLIAVPLKSCAPEAKRGTLGALVVCAVDEAAFGPGEIALFEELADSMVMGVESRRMRVAYEAAVEAERAQERRREQSLEETIKVINGIMEERDPYTAGHQNRVGELAVMIGKELGFDEDRLRGLHLGGLVHDLGKIRVPSEILAKLGGLTPAEFARVRCHPEVGYRLLKGIDFPWPIADMVRQHHEYADGSGYPQGLKGDQIRLESQILTVADIVEAISSERPYRAALGIGEALREITQLRGAKLDERAVDACVAVLQRGAFLPHAFGSDGTAGQPVRQHKAG